MRKQQIVKLATASVVVASVSVLGIVSLVGELKVAKKELQMVRESKQELQDSYIQLQQDFTNLDTKNKELYLEYKQVRDILYQELSYNPSDITESSGASVIHLTKALEGTELQSLAPTFYQAEQDYGINSIILASLVATESAWGESNRAINDNNMTGYAVYSDSSKGIKFDSKEECILRTARLLKEDYIDPQSKHNTGASIWDINKVYSSDENWADKIASISKSLVNKGEFI